MRFCTRRLSSGSVIFDHSISLPLSFDVRLGGDAFCNDGEAGERGLDPMLMGCDEVGWAMEVGQGR